MPKNNGSPLASDYHGFPLHLLFQGFNPGTQSLPITSFFAGRCATHGT
ncbi:MAG: hypothetical protein HC925_07890 [Coleofasciculaceae cyanobacterium SM2_3_26]|nr:hypothetical protein [Coleofasciculaceae cyanobacterium SM2_3_26]